MKIISSFSDYYDGVSNSIGVDADDLTYVRRSLNIECGKLSVREVFDYQNSIPCSESGYGHLVSPIAIFFCGKAYSVLQYDGSIFTSYDSLYLHVKDRAFKNNSNATGLLEMFDEADRTIAIKGEKFYSNFFTYFKRLSSSSWEKVRQGKDIDHRIFREVKAPVFMITKRYFSREMSLITNPRLEHYRFGHFVDAFQAYQEIDMFLGNNMVEPIDNSINRTDELIRDSKGFDKNSFKNLSPGGRKSRREKKKKNIV